MSDRTNHVTSTFWGCVQNSNVVTAGGDVQLTLANGAVLSLRQEDWVDFSDLITKVTQRLVGRGFVFEKVADFIQSNPCGYFRVIADAGLGKTAIAAELTKRYLAVACFISASENRTQPERIINILTAQLVARYALPYNSLIEKFEENYYPIPQGTPNFMLMHLTDARDITTEALAEVIDSLEVALQIVNGDSPSETLLLTERLRQREHTISKTQAEALADYFHVDASLFT